VDADTKCDHFSPEVPLRGTDARRTYCMSDFSALADAPHAEPQQAPSARKHALRVAQVRTRRALRAARFHSYRATRAAVAAGGTSRGRAGYLAGAFVVICLLLALSPSTPGETTATAANRQAFAAAPAALVTTAATQVGAARSLTPLDREVRVSRARAARVAAAHAAVLRTQIRRAAAAHAAHMRHVAAVAHARTARARAHRAALRRYRLARVRVMPIWRSFVIGEGFGVRGYHWGSGVHTGIDLDVPTGTRVHAAMAGTVISAKWEGSYGYCIRIRHYNGVVTRYAHLSHIKAHQGKYVQAGAVIGLSGATGNTTGPHLHFEVIINGKPVNPRHWL